MSAPAGTEPLRALGTRIPEFFEADLAPDRAAEFQRLRAALETAAGCRLAPAEVFAGLAAWYLVRFPARRTDVVIYHRSPESRVPGATVQHPRFRLLATPEARVRWAFRWTS